MNLGLLHPPMGSKQVDLSAYKATGFDRGASVLKEGLWLPWETTFGLAKILGF